MPFFKCSRYGERKPMTHLISSLPSILDREKIPILQVRTLKVRIEEPAELIYLVALPEVSAK